MYLSDSFSVIIKIDENQCFCRLRKNLSDGFNYLFLYMIIFVTKEILKF